MRVWRSLFHYTDVIMGAIASQITSLTIVYSTVYSDADQRKHQSSTSLAFVRGIHRWPVNSLHRWPVTRNMFPFDDVIICLIICIIISAMDIYYWIIELNYIRKSTIRLQKFMIRVWWWYIYCKHINPRRVMWGKTPTLRIHAHILITNGWNSLKLIHNQIRL